MVISSPFLSNGQIAANLLFDEKLLIFILMPNYVFTYSFCNKLKFRIKIDCLLFVNVKQISSLLCFDNDINLIVKKSSVENYKRFSIERYLNYRLSILWLVEKTRRIRFEKFKLLFLVKHLLLEKCYILNLNLNEIETYPLIFNWEIERVKKGVLLKFDIFSLWSGNIRIKSGLILTFYNKLFALN